MKRAIVLVLVATIAHAEPARDQRVAYIAKLLAAIRTSDATTTADMTKYIGVMERNKCRAPEMSLRVGCLVEATKQYCKSDDAVKTERCLQLSDVIVTNRLSEPIFVPKEVR